MSRPLLEVADLIRSAGTAFIERNRPWLRWQHIKVLRAIRRCRTAALGGHLDECTRCGHRAAISYNSCRNRHCPKCQTSARERWIAARQRELLPTRYVHVVFTLPHRLAPLALQNKKILYDLLFRASAETLLEVARDPRHLGAEIGFFSVLHTWSQKLGLHPHVHCVIPAGGLSLDHAHWIPSRERFFLPIHVLRHVFRGKFVAGLRQAFQLGELNFHGDLTLLAQPKTFAAWLRPLYRTDWIVYLKPPFGGPEYVLQYLGRYTHRVAISNHRLISLADGNVTFRWRDSAHNNEQKLLTLSLDEFLRRFLLHLLPKGFVRIRNFGFLANRRRAITLPLCLSLLGSPTEAKQEASTPSPCDLWRCSNCGGPMRVIQRFTAADIQLRSPPLPVKVAA
jgi:Putative transposase/Transposase zinc-binding domain